jgi:hypothetical protein
MTWIISEPTSAEKSDTPHPERPTRRVRSGPPGGNGTKPAAGPDPGDCACMTQRAAGSSQAWLVAARLGLARIGAEGDPADRPSRIPTGLRT